MKRNKFYPVVLLVFNILNTTFTNLLVILIISYKSVSLRMPYFIIFGFVICIVQVLLVGDLKIFLKSLSIYLILLGIFKLRHKVNETFIRSTHQVIISVHSLAWCYFMLTGWQFGRSDGKAFSGFFDEPSVASYVLGTYLIVSSSSKLLSGLTVVFILLSDSMTGVIFIAWFLMSKDYFRYDIIVKMLFGFIIVLTIMQQTDWRLNKELLQVLMLISELSEVDPAVRTSSSGFRILYEIYYALEVFNPVRIESFLGGTYFPLRTASLNVVTELLMTVGLIGTLCVFIVVVRHLRLTTLTAQKIGGVFLLCFSTGAFLKPIFIWCLFLYFSQRHRA